MAKNVTKIVMVFVVSLGAVFFAGCDSEAQIGSAIGAPQSAQVPATCWATKQTKRLQPPSGMQSDPT